jgi:hypothetical protein
MFTNLTSDHHPGPDELNLSVPQFYFSDIHCNIVFHPTTSGNFPLGFHTKTQYALLFTLGISQPQK